MGLEWLFKCLVDSIICLSKGNPPIAPLPPTSCPTLCAALKSRALKRQRTQQTLPIPTPVPWVRVACLGSSKCFNQETSYIIVVGAGYQGTGTLVLLGPWDIFFPAFSKKCQARRPSRPLARTWSIVKIRCPAMPSPWMLMVRTLISMLRRIQEDSPTYQSCWVGVDQKQRECFTLGVRIDELVCTPTVFQLPLSAPKMASMTSPCHRRPGERPQRSM